MDGTAGDAGVASAGEALNVVIVFSSYFVVVRVPFRNLP
jgi:hypothetical protein